MSSRYGKPVYPLDNDLVRDRYQNDPMFRQLADIVCNMIASGHIDSVSASTAAVLGAQIYAERYAAPVTVVMLAPPMAQPTAKQMELRMKQEALMRELDMYRQLDVRVPEDWKARVIRDLELPDLDQLEGVEP